MTPGQPMDLAPGSQPVHIQTELTFEHVRRVNVARLIESWSDHEPWSPERWGIAFVGEAGETLEAVLLFMMKATTAMNSLKKVVRGDGDPAKVGQEVADTILYGDLLLRSLNIDTARAIRETFNAKSREIGSNITL